MHEERFHVLPHPEVGDYIVRKAADVAAMKARAAVERIFRACNLCSALCSDGRELGGGRTSYTRDGIVPSLGS